MSERDCTAIAGYTLINQKRSISDEYQMEQGIVGEEGARIPVLANVDVLVVGGGTAGGVAAVASARNGAKTLLVEQFGFLGGTATGGLVFPMMPNHIGGRPLDTGISSEIQQELARIGEGGSDSWGNDGWFNPEALKYVLEEMVLKSGARILYHVFASKPVMEGNKVIGAVIETKSGRMAILSRVAIDATGDADIAVKAGVPYDSGNAEDGKSQHMSLRFLMGNVNLERLQQFLKKTDLKGEYVLPYLEFWMVPGKNQPLETIFRKGVRDQMLEEDDIVYFQAFAVPGRPGEVGFNCPRIMGSLKSFNPWDLTEAQIQGKTRITRLVTFMRKYVEGFENAYLSQTAPMVGIRESRRIRGEYMLTAEDYFEGRKFDDAVARNRYPIDIHLPTQKASSLWERELGPTEYHEIPYRCMVPLKVENLLVAGRCLSATFEAQGAVRIQPNMRALGQAAGTAAASCVKQGILPRQLDGRGLRKLLRSQGANL